MTSKSPTSSHRARRAAIYLVVGAILLTGGGWLGSRFITTPAQLAAEAKPPSPSIITVPIQKRVVSDTLVTRGTVRSQQQTNVLAGRTVADAKLTVVTALPVPAGGEIAVGSVVVEMSGRPVIALPGKFPAYRDLNEGTQGPDVAQLQKALTSVGLKIGRDLPGVYSSGTAAAISGLYKKDGYAAQPNLPMSEVLYLPTFPGRISTSTATLGSDVATSELNVATGSLDVYVDSDPEIAQVAKPASRVEISSELLSKTVTGVVARAEQAPPSGQQSQSGSQPTSGAGASAPSIQVVIAPDEALSSEWANEDVRVTFTNGSSDGNVLAVPISAVFATPEGKRAITVKRGSHRVQIAVVTGVVGGGYAEIKSAAAKISAGDQVVVGSS